VAPRAGARSLGRALDRVHGRVQHVGDLGRGEPEDVAQEEDGELAGRQDLERGHEGRGNGFRLLVTSFRVEEDVGMGLEPDGLAERSVLRHRLVAIR
jgi:hypothetical protein